MELFTTPERKIKMIKITNKKYVRSEVEKDSRNIYVFTENLDRTSGSNLIVKSGNQVIDDLYLGKHYPNVSQAVIRGLRNAYPITTKLGQWKGELFEPQHYDLFCREINNDILRIRIAQSYSDFDNLIFSTGGFAMEKSSLPHNFAEYLKIRLEQAFNLTTNIIKKDDGMFGLCF